jgi:hypothetical protein
MEVRMQYCCVVGQPCRPDVTHHKSVIIVLRARKGSFDVWNPRFVLHVGQQYRRHEHHTPVACRQCRDEQFWLDSVSVLNNEPQCGRVEVFVAVSQCASTCREPIFCAPGTHCLKRSLPHQSVAMQ